MYSFNGIMLLLLCYWKYLIYMRRFIFLSLFSSLFISSVQANWQKINDVDYVWGPFKIYNISLFSETGEYVENTRPLMLTLKYAKPVDGRDFAISLARSWSNLGITLKDQDDVVDRLRKILPNIKKDDVLSYIALNDKGYFVLNDTIIPEEFNQEFNDAVVAVWLDPRVEIGRKLIEKKEQQYTANTPHVVSSQDVKVAEEPKVEHSNEQSHNTAVIADKKKGDESNQLETNTEKQPSETKEEKGKSPILEERQDDSEIEIIPASDPIPESEQPKS